jgi:hypothetical protein
VKFLHMMNVVGGPYRHDTWPPGDFEVHLAYMMSPFVFGGIAKPRLS